jgi:multiple sugar transport system ATP-binding protein
MVFQNYALYPHMTVYRNMAFGLNLRRRSLGLTRADIDRKVRETAARLGVEELLNRRPRELSGGERQRVAVGRAIVRSPRLFLFDEPLSNLDARLRLEMRSEIKRLVRSLSTTTLYVTHDQEEAMTLGDRVVVMKDGVVQQVGRPLEVYERPANRFVAGFVGMPPMNFVDGRLERGGGGLSFADGRTALRLPASKAALVAGWADRPVVLGIRPDAISPAPAERSGGVGGNDGGSAARLGVKVTQVESGARLVGRVEARCELQEGQEVSMFIDMNRVHLFEPGESGVNLTAGSMDAVTTQDAGRVE